MNKSAALKVIIHGTEILFAWSWSRDSDDGGDYGRCAGR